MIYVFLIFTFLTSPLLATSESKLDPVEIIDYDVLLVETTEAVAKLEALYASGERLVDMPIPEVATLERLFKVDIMDAPPPQRVALQKAYFQSHICSLKRGDEETLRDLRSRWSSSFVLDLPSLLSALTSPEHTNEMNDLIEEILQQPNMKSLIKNQQDSLSFLYLAAQRGHVSTFRELLTYSEPLRPETHDFLGFFEVAAAFNQTVLMSDFLSLRFGEAYLLTQENIDASLINAAQNKHKDAIEAIMRSPRAPGIPFPSEGAISEARTHNPDL